MDTLTNRFLYLTPTFRDNSTNIVAFRIFTLSVKKNLFLFVCVSRINFPHFDLLVALSRPSYV